MRIEQTLIKNIEKSWLPFHDKEAFVVGTHTVTFADFERLYLNFSARISEMGIEQGTPVLISGDINPETIALLWACIRHNLICIPHIDNNSKMENQRIQIAKPAIKVTAELIQQFPIEARLNFTSLVKEEETPDYYREIQRRKKPGLVLFTSGTSGVPKAAVHDFSLLLEKFKGGGKPFRTLGFLLFDHWGGLNTILHSLGSGGTLICIMDRSPSGICQAISKHKAELLPVSPSFMNLLLASGEYKKHDLSSLQLATYGAEPMPKATLKALKTRLPSLKLKQTYGLIELGVFPTKGKDEASLFFKIDKDKVDFRIIDEMLEIKSKSAMLGYLNALSPFTEDGYFQTGDKVIVDGDYLQVLGRESEIINVGGEKVFPAEVESILLEIDGVIDSRVYGEENFLLGNIVCAEIHCAKNVDLEGLENHIKLSASRKLESFKVPAKIVFTTEAQIGNRLKKKRL